MTEEQEKLLDISVELGKLANQADLYADLLDAYIMDLRSGEPTAQAYLIKLLPKLRDALSSHSKELCRLSDATCPED
ncbi:hypothetical protein NSA02_10460 [Ligilactobacillus murinus]|uniref:hypothetical protein n=1 Tax=Ligilactobacillus murinus TaxID=1622 RepID=UPI00214BA90A|nr:hypothetical protein [Ligilactobacillus murinus]MCR1897212.1 hypothetical protein [Ligilactobacillus murinus]